MPFHPPWTRRAGDAAGPEHVSPASVPLVPGPREVVPASGYATADVPPGGEGVKPVRSVLALAAGVVAVTTMTGAAIISFASTGPPSQARQILPAAIGAAVPGRPPVLVWTPGGLPPHLAGVARGAAGAGTVAEVSGDFAWLDAWSGPGAGPSVPPAGMSVPMDVAAVDLPDFLPFVAGPDRDTLAGLGSGSVVLSRTGAALRGVAQGGWLRFGATTLTVGGVVEDAAIGGHEAVVTKGAGALIGVTQPRYLLVRPDPGAGPGALEDALRASLPAGSPLRVRVPAAGTVHRAGEPRLTPADLKKAFGEFAAVRGRGGALRLDPAWVAANIQERSLPIVGLTKCHKALFPLVEGALNEIIADGLTASIQPGGFGGCWFPRFVNWDPEAGISHHTWGLAVDFNVGENPYGTPGRMDPRVVEVFERWGFEWGGRWLVPDPMHFEFTSGVTPPR